MNAKVIVFAASVLILAVMISIYSVEDGVVPFVPEGAGLKPLSIGGTPLRVYVVDEPREREQGLSGRTRLPLNQGMFFVFEKDDMYGIWMRDMKFPIDVFWISEEKIVTDIEANVAPESYPKVFRPHVPARYVLEVPAGFAEQYNIKIGDGVAVDL